MTAKAEFWCKAGLRRGPRQGLPRFGGQRLGE
jgi:hypothetical protein